MLTSRVNLLKNTNKSALINYIKHRSFKSYIYSPSFKSLVQNNISYQSRLFSTSTSTNDELPIRESMLYDVVIVGAGPSGLSAAIKLKQLCIQNNVELSICIVEKGAEIGSHILSGNVFDTKALDELFPNWKNEGCPISTQVKKENFLFLTEKYGIKLPVPSLFHNTSENYIISLGELCKWLGTKAEELGVEIFPGFSASEILYENNKVVGIATADQGIKKDGTLKSTFTRGVEIKSNQILLAEGCRGSLAESIINKYNLRSNCDPQTYAIGLKEVWQVNSGFQEGLVEHSVGWPLDANTYGGAFLYHMKPNYVLLGLAVGLDYKDPYLNPYEEFQRWKTHPHVQKHIKDGTCISYGARALNEGGFQSIPKLSFPGGLLVGDSAGFLNPARLKGSHTAMKSGMLAAENIFKHINSGSESSEITSYETELKDSWVYKELHAVRNVHSGFKYGRYFGMIHAAFIGFVSKGREFWTFRNKSKTTDAMATGKASNYSPRPSFKPDGKITFDILSNLQRSGTMHDHDQLSHLSVKPELSSMPEKSLKGN